MNLNNRSNLSWEQRVGGSNGSLKQILTIDFTRDIDVSGDELLFALGHRSRSRDYRCIKEIR